MNNLDQNGFAIKNTRIKVYNYSFDEKEFISTTYEYVVEGSGIPALSTLIEPDADKIGFTQVFNEGQQSWEYVEDHRYEDVYNIHTKQKEEIRYIGALKPEHTTLAPPSIDHEFIGGSWIITEEKQVEIENINKQNEINNLQNELAMLEQKIVFGSVMGDDISQYKERVIEVRLELEKLQS